MLKNLIPIIFMVLGCCYTGSLLGASSEVEKAKIYIEKCAKEYSEMEGTHRNEMDINKVYVLLAEDVFEIEFSRGEFGSFSERTSDYRLFFSCYVKEMAPPIIFYLAQPAPNSKIYIGEIGYRAIAGMEKSVKDDAVDMMFERIDGEFVFREMKKNDREKVSRKLRESYMSGQPIPVQ